MSGDLPACGVRTGTDLKGQAVRTPRILDAGVASRKRQGVRDRVHCLARNPARDQQAGFLSADSVLIAAVSEVISCERSPTSAADIGSTRERILASRMPLVRSLRLPPRIPASTWHTLAMCVVEAVANLLLP